MKNTLNLIALLLVCINNNFAQNMNTELITQRCMKGVVYIENSGGLGSGFLVSSKGYVITNHHVIYNEYYGYRNADFVEFEDGKRYSATVVKYDENKDLALLRLSGWKEADTAKYKPLPLVENDAKKGIPIMALGHPGGLKFTVTNGILSNDNPLPDLPDADFLMQTNVTVNQGNSGGPLVNKNGQVTGVVVMKLTIFEGTNFAIKASAVKRFIKSYHTEVPYITTPLIFDKELQGNVRELTKEEEEAAKQAELERIEKQRIADQARIEAQQKAEKEKIEAEKTADLQKIQLNAQQEKELQMLDFEHQSRLQQQRQQYEQERQKKEQELALQRIEEQKQRELLLLEQDKHDLDRSKLELVQRRKAYFATLPARIRLGLGAGAGYYFGAISQMSNAASHGLSQVHWGLQAQVAYRLDIKPHNNRASTIGLFISLGSLSRNAANLTAQQQNNSTSLHRSVNVFSEWEIGSMVKEWLRISTGIGSQQLHRTDSQLPATLYYASTTIGLHARLHAYLELYWNTNIRYGLGFKQLSLRSDLGLMFRFGVGKW